MDNRPFQILAVKKVGRAFSIHCQLHYPQTVSLTKHWVLLYLPTNDYEYSKCNNWLDSHLYFHKAVNTRTMISDAILGTENY
jgi:hypothetical protein